MYNNWSSSPSGKTLSLTYVTAQDRDTKDLLQNSFPDGIENFNFNLYGDDLIPICYYQLPLMNLSSKVKGVMYLFGFELNETQFCYLLEANKGREGGVLEFDKCKIKIDPSKKLSCDLYGLKLSTLKFLRYEADDEANLKTYLDGITTVLNGLGIIPKFLNQTDEISISFF
jgi:hypothetical protein